MRAADPHRVEGVDDEPVESIAAIAGWMLRVSSSCWRFSTRLFHLYG